MVTKFLAKPGAFLLATFFLQACETTSSLSDSDNLQPGQLRVNMEAVKERRGSSGSVTPYFEARFYDRRGDRVELKHGQVFVNGVVMSRQESFTGLVYYRLSGGGVSFQHDFEYVFRVVLDTASGVAYESTVKTQAGDLTQATRTIAGGQASFTWQGDTTQAVRVGYLLYRKSDSTSAERTKAFPAPQVRPLQVSLEGYDTLRTPSLETVKTGTIHPSFRSGSIESIVRWAF